LESRFTISWLTEATDAEELAKLAQGREFISASKREGDTTRFANPEAIRTRTKDSKSEKETLREISGEESKEITKRLFLSSLNT